jgi:glutathione S-transferase
LSPFSARLRLAVALKGLEVSFEPPPGGSGSAELKTLTPFGRIPVLVQNGKILVESLALLDYLEDSHPGTRRLRPEDPLQLARVRMIALLFDHNVIKALNGVFAQLMLATVDATAARAALDDVEHELEKLTRFFDSSGPAVGGEWSIADCAMVPFAFLIDVLSPGFGASSPTQRVPRFTEWWTEASKLPEVAAVTARMSKALSAMMAAKKAQAQAHA